MAETPKLARLVRKLPFKNHRVGEKRWVEHALRPSISTSLSKAYSVDRPAVCG
ncbi:hypothetical protein LguiB_036123 [Lonicera macranthoides]